MKRRNADTGKLRRPIKRTKITEGMYGNSMLYLKFIMVWALVVLADYMLEFRCEFLWPFWMMLRSVYDSYKYQGLAFSVFFMCIALTSDMICFFFIPIQYVFFAASTYVWGQYVWYTFADKGICLPTVAICCLIVYIEGLRGAWVSSGGYGRPLAAHCVGYPAVTLGVGVKKYVVRRLRQRTQRHVRAINEFYYALMRDAVPQSEAVCECESSCASTRTMNGAANGKKRKPEQNGHCLTEQKSETVEPPIDKKCTRERDKLNHAPAAGASNGASGSPGAQSSHLHANGTATGPGIEDDEKHNHCKGSAKSMKYDKKEAATIKEEKREEKKRNKKDKEKDVSDSVKSIEHTKEQIVKDKEVESTKECVRNKESNNSRDKDKEKERERDRDKEREVRERDREREKELLSLQRAASECADELKRVKAELAASQRAEAEARKALEAAGARDKLRRQDHAHLKQAHAALHHKVSAWRAGERAALERRLSEERRARSRAEHQLLQARTTPSGECENSECAARRTTADSELAALRRELTLARDAALALQRDCARAHEQVVALECRVEWRGGAGGAGGAAARASQLERALAAETRVKLDLLAALGEANRKMQIQDSVINRQEKQLEELKAQMLAVMPTEFVTPVTTAASKLRLSDSSPLDPNASVYTPKQLCSDA